MDGSGPGAGCTGGFLGPITTVHAEWEEHLWLRCDDDGDAATREVEEGEDYRVEVRAKHEATGFPIKVYWYTDAGTADEKDYPGMNGVGQAANRSQNSDGRMGRDLQTTEDNFSEKQEQFTLRFENASNSDDATDDSCAIYITDDDGFGAHKTWIDSEPEDGEAYRAGEKIVVKQEFTHDVSVTGNPGVTLRIGNRTRLAYYTSHDEDGYTSVTYEYTVRSNDLDTNGITVPDNSYVNNSIRRTIGTDHSTDPPSPHGGETANCSYRGVAASEVQKVDPRPHVTGVRIVSSPPDGLAYRPGQHIEVALDFERAVTVAGAIPIGLDIGSEDSPVQASYNRGAGTETLVFRYTVEAGDSDTDGIGVPADGSGGSGAVRTTIDAAVQMAYDALEDQADHKVDGRAYAKAAEITSTPAKRSTYDRDETVEVTLTFDRAVELQETPTIHLSIGFRDESKDTSYLRGSGTDKLVFGYVVTADDFDYDGVELETQESNGFGGTGGVYHEDTDDRVYDGIPGFADQASHKVDGRSRAIAVTFASTPKEGNTYGKGETIEFDVEFNRVVAAR